MASIRTTTVGVAVLGVGLLVGACASPAAKTAAPVAPSPPTQSAPPAQVAAPAPAAPVVQTVPVAHVAPVEVAPVDVAPVDVAPVSAPPVAPVAATAVATPPSRSSAPSASTPPSDSAPHFTTPDDAMRYLAAAYNSGDEIAIRHVTTPSSRSDFEAERQWVKTFRFRDCTPIGAPYWSYNCTLDITANVPGVSPDIDATTGLVVMDEVALEVSPAARTGYYVDAVEGCGG